MPHFTGNGIDICFEQQGGRTDVPLILLHGIGCQLTQWSPALLDALAAAELRLIRPDNRDAGRSAQLEGIGLPDPATPPYRLQDMAADVVALLDHLGLMDAHVLGVSMGGMIAQHLAMGWPDRVRSLISVMSTTGNPALPPGSPEAVATLTAAPPALDRASLIAHHQHVWDVIGGPHYRSSEVGIGSLAETTIDRGQSPAGFLRQFAAVTADGSRVERLGAVTAPTLVIHGDADPLIPPAAGRDTANAIPAARYVEIEGLGHDLPAPLADRIASTVVAFIQNVEASRRDLGAQEATS